MRIVIAFLLLVLCAGCDKLGFRIISESEYQELKKSQQAGSNKPRYAKGMQGNNEFLEYYAWEEIDPTPKRRGIFKQVKKIYFMTNQVCSSVVSVLNRPQLSNGSDYYCFPAHIDPNEYYKRYSANSDLPNH